MKGVGDNLIRSGKKDKVSIFYLYLHREGRGMGIRLLKERRDVMNMIRKFAVIVFVFALAVSAVVISDVKVGRAEDYSSAPVLSFDGSWSGERYFTESEKEHWYKIVIPSDGEWNMRIMSYIDQWVTWKLYNSDLSVAVCDGSTVSGSETAPKTTSEYYALSKGTYYFKVSINFGIGKYKLHNTFTSYNVNDIGADSYDSPYIYQLGTMIKGALTRTDKEDWYKITIPSKGYYTLKYVSYISNSQWVLYNDDLSQKIDERWVYYGTDSNPVTNKNDCFLSKGTYYVKVAFTRDYGKYKFQLSKLTKNTCSHDYQSTYHEATYFAKGYTKYHCKKCGYSYKGNYVPVKQLSQVYLYSYCSGGKGKLNLSWSSVYNATGYQIRYSQDRTFKSGTDMKKCKGQSKNKKVISGLSRKKKYYVQVRACRQSGSKIAYGKWSGKKCIKTT